MTNTAQRTDGRDVDVLVIGGGPTGVATALFCLARGLSVEVVEKQGDVYPLPRAVVIDDEIQRALASIDIDVSAITTKMSGAEFLNGDGEQIIGIELPEDGDYPYGFFPVVFIHQPTFEGHLRRLLRERGGAFSLETEVHDFSEQVDAMGQRGVHATLRNAQGERTITARWLVAADGASSQSRAKAGLALTDLEFDEEWVVVDVLMRRAVNLSKFSQQVCSPQRIVTVVPGHGNWRRWEFQVKPGETGAELTEPARLQELLSPWIGPDDGTVERFAVYRFHATVANSMRAGHIFLAGDSAHQMPPFLGQGMCSGIRDAINLAWKFDLVARNVADHRLLDSYDDERRPHATGVVHHAIDTGKLMNHIAATGGADDASAGYGGTRPFPKLNGGLMAGENPVVGRQVPNPVLPDGRRLDDHLPRSFSVLTSAANAAAVEVLLRSDVVTRFNATVVQVDPARFPFLVSETNAVLLRPDFTIAAILEVATVEALNDARHQLTTLIDRWFGPAQ